MWGFRVDSYIKFTYNGETVEGFITKEDKESIYINGKPYTKELAKTPKLRYYTVQMQRSKGAPQTINSTVRTKTTNIIDQMFFHAVKMYPNNRIWIGEMFL